MRSRIWGILRKIAMVGPTKEEMQRMIEEDRKANTTWIPGTNVGVEDCFMEFGARREDYGYSSVEWVNEIAAAMEARSDQEGTKAGTGSVEPDAAEDGRDA